MGGGGGGLGGIFPYILWRLFTFNLAASLHFTLISVSVGEHLNMHRISHPMLFSCKFLNFSFMK